MHKELVAGPPRPRAHHNPRANSQLVHAHVTSRYRSHSFFPAAFSNAADYSSKLRLLGLVAFAGRFEKVAGGKTNVHFAQKVKT